MHGIIHAIFITEIFKIKTVQLAASLSALSFKEHSEPETFLLLNRHPGKPKLLQISYIPSFLHCIGNTEVQNIHSDLQTNTSDRFRCIHSFLSPPTKNSLIFFNKRLILTNLQSCYFYLNHRRHRPKLSAPLAFTPHVILYPYIISPVFMIL